MGVRLPYTPRSKIRAALRQLFLRSRERSSAVKREKNVCQRCHRKGSSAKGKEVQIEVHHVNGIEWEELIDYVYRHLLCDPKFLEVLCKECHNLESKGENNGKIT